MKKLSFKMKLIGLCLLLLAVSVVIGGISYRGLQKVENAYDQVTDGVMPNLNLLNDMYLSYRAVRINLRTLGLPGLSKEVEAESVKGTLAAIEEYERLAKVYEAIPFIAGEKELYDDVEKAWHHFKGVGERALGYHKSGKPEDHEKLMNIFLEDCPKAAGDYGAAMGRIKEFHEKNAKNFVAEAKDIGHQANNMVFVTAAFGILLGTGLGLLFATAMTKAIRQVTTRLAQSAETVTTASVQIAGSSEKLSQSATEQAASLEQTAASLEQITAMIGKSSSNADSTSARSQESQEKADKGREAVDLMVSSMGEISRSNEEIMKQIDASNRQMGEIVSVIQEIGNKTKVINEIVFQTKLLSFNASVEAARAGEHGKGFAVVAEEVGNLAAMSGNAAKEISEMLGSSIPKVEAIVQDTKSRVEVLVAEARRKVDSGVDVAKQCSEVLKEIVENVKTVSSLAHEISSAGKEQTQGVTEITKAMGQLDTVTQHNATASAEAASAAEELSAQALSLQKAVEELVATVEGASAEANPPVAASRAPAESSVTAAESKAGQAPLAAVRGGGQRPKAAASIPSAGDVRFTDV